MSIQRNVTSPSTRSVTRESGTFTRDTSGSRSLERGLQILRAFRTGTVVLSNAELAARTDLPRPTVSRLTRSLVEQGFLDYDLAAQGYKLAPVFLSLADAFRHADGYSEAAYRLMRDLAKREGVNVGLAIPDRLEMVYLESFRESRKGVFRHATAGSRFPMELTSGGRAYLASLESGKREAILNRIGSRYGAEWPHLLQQIEDAVLQIQQTGYCVAHWQPGMTAVGTQISKPSGKLYTLTLSFHSPDSESAAIAKYGRLLLELKGQILQEWLGESRL